MTDKVKCTKEELNAWLDQYPRKLQFDVSGICDPPSCTYNDFSLGNWPESVVAGFRGDRGRDLANGYWHLKDLPPLTKEK